MTSEKHIKCVRMHSVYYDSTYIATCLRDCKTFIDQQAYESAIRAKDTILLGEVCAEPVWIESLTLSDER